MLNYSWKSRPDSLLDDPAAGEQMSIDFDRLIAMARRQWRMVVVCVVAALICGAVYVLTAIPQYTSEVGLLIDNSNKKIVDQLSLVSGVADDDASILSQVELLKSDRIAQAVVEKLDLSNNKAFMQSRTSGLAIVLGYVKAAVDFRNWFTSDAVENQDQLVRDAMERLSNNLDVTRVGRTYVLNVSFTSPDAQLARRIARQYGESYLDDQLNSKYEATRRAGDWLQQRIQELKQKSLDTDLAVQKFRQENELISTQGTLLSDQQLTQTNAQLIIAQSNLATANARYSSIKTIIDSGNIDSAVTDSLDNKVVNTLRQKYVEASKLEQDISRRLGPDHIRAQQLRADMGEYQKLMFDELRRIAQSYQVDAQSAQQRVEELNQQLKAATSVSVTANSAQVQLRELEREAETYKNLYQNFLQKYQESVQQQSFPVTEARVITPASLPDQPSKPKKMLVMLASAVLGLMAGVGIGAFREYRDRFFRVPEQVREDLDIEPLGMIPKVASTVVEATDGEDDRTNPRFVVKTTSVADYVVKNPLSSFAETLRSTKIAIDMQTGNKKCKVIGMVSILPGEGKSTLSVNFAELLASQGARTLLIDGDLRNPGATRLLGRHATSGLLEVVRGGVALPSALMFNRDTKLAFLPAVVKHRIPYSSEILSSTGMDILLEAAAENFDYVIIDLPPLGPVVDARAIASKVDCFTLVIEWGETSRKAVRNELIKNMPVVDKCVGAILNKVDSSKSKLYEAYGSSEYYAYRYKSYYHEG
jgi:succinoglycan biosynthesis transport protein ExoP